MRVCMSVSRLAPSEKGVIVGGPINTMATLSRSLVARGHTISILAGCPGSCAVRLAAEHMPWAELWPVLTSVGVGGVRRGVEFTAKGIVQSVGRQAQLREMDVFHSHSGYPQLALVASAAGVWIRIPTVHTLYSALSAEVEETRRPSLLASGVARFCLSKVDRIIAISRNVARSLQNIGVLAERIRVVPPAVDEHSFHSGVSGEQWRQRLGVNDGEKLVMYLGNLTRTKGLDLFVSAIDRLARQNLKFRAVYALQKQHPKFEGRRGEIRKRLRDSGLADRVFELGPVPDMPSLMAAADVFVSPLRSTNGLADYPISVVEAMMLGRPIVATRTGGVLELIADGKTGLLAEPGNVTELSNKIKELLTRKTLAYQVGRNASRFALQRFSTDRVTTLILDVYREVLRDRRHGYEDKIS